jgi:hypothetical protein
VVAGEHQEAGRHAAYGGRRVESTDMSLLARLRRALGFVREHDSAARSAARSSLWADDRDLISPRRASLNSYIVSPQLALAIYVITVVVFGLAVALIVELR